MATIAISPFLLVIHPDIPAGSVAEFVAYAKANPAKISYASAGAGTLPHLFGELLKQRTGIEMLHVPYRGSAPAITDLLAGQVHMYIDNTRNILPFVQAGKLRALAVTSETRAAELPDLPTMPESGHGEFWRPIGTACWLWPERRPHHRQAQRRYQCEPATAEQAASGSA